MWVNDLTEIVIFVWIMPIFVRIKCCYTEDFYLQVLLQVLSHCLQYGLLPFCLCVLI